MTKQLNRNNKLLFKMFRGIVITNAISLLANIACVMIDSIVTGQFLGPDAVAAAGLLHPVIMMINLIGGILGGVGIMCSRYMGKAEPERVNQVFSIVLITALSVSLALTVLLFIFAPRIAYALGAKTGSQEIVRMMKDYLRGFCFAIIFMRITVLLSGLMLLDNDKNCSIKAMIVTLIADLVFDLSNVLIFHGGMFGMAIATSLSYVAGFLVILNHYRRKDRVIHFTVKGLRLGDLRDVCLRGLPHAINMGSQAFRLTCFNMLILSIADKNAVAGLAVCSGAFSIVMALALAMFVSSSILSSLLYGEEDRRGIEKGLSLSIRTTLVIFIVIAILTIFFPVPVARLFVRADAAQVVAQGARFIRFWGIQFLFSSISFPLGGFYQGTGHLKLDYLIDIMRETVLPVVCVLGLGRAFGMRGAEAGFALVGLLTLLTCLLIPLLCRKRFPLSARAYIVLPDHFGAKPEEQFEASMHDINEVMAASEQTLLFCRERGADKRTANLLSLFVEEVAGNTVSHGFSDRQGGSVDLRLVYKSDSIVIRFRDDGSPFDPILWLEKNSSKDPASGMGIRMVTGLAKEVDYLAAMEMNNLVVRL